MKTALVVVGTRPEAIKLAPVIRALRDGAAALRPVVCATAQHREMLDQVMGLFEIVPDHDLDVMREGQTLTFVTGAVLERMGALLDSAKPDVVVVQGDTTTTMASSLAAFYRRIPVAHVEAGLRTDDRYSPFPEEINRRLVSQLAELHFAATDGAARRLRAEGVGASSVHVTGNPVVDAVLWIRSRARTPEIPGLGARSRVVLVTAHRRESFGEPIRAVCRALRGIVESHGDVEVVYPVHPNPNVTGPVREILGGRERVHLLPPVAYDAFVGLMDRSYLILSDSGGVQEEAPVLGKPVLVLREKTERGEAIAAGGALLVGTSEERIRAEADRLLDDPAAYEAMARRRSPFGDGHASERIADLLRRFVA